MAPLLLIESACKPQNDAAAGDKTMSDERRDSQSGIWSIVRSVELERLLGAPLEATCCVQIAIADQRATFHTLAGRTIAIRAERVGDDAFVFSSNEAYRLTGLIREGGGVPGAPPWKTFTFSRPNQDSTAVDGYWQPDQSLESCLREGRETAEIDEAERRTQSGPP